MWVDVPTRQPYTCAMCGNGAERGKDIQPFFQTEWTFVGENGAEHVFIVCRQCVVAMVTDAHSPLRGQFSRGSATPAIPTVQHGGEGEFAPMEDVIAEKVVSMIQANFMIAGDPK